MSILHLDLRTHDIMGSQPEVYKVAIRVELNATFEEVLNECYKQVVGEGGTCILNMFKLLTLFYLID
jgi:hypothetical protein